MAQVCLTREEATEATIGVFDAAFLPRAMGIAEIGLDTDRIAQFVMVGELGAVVLGEAAAQLGRQTRQPIAQLGFGWLGLAAGWLCQQDISRSALLSDQHRLAIATEQQIVGFPVAGLPTGVDVKRAFCDGNPVLYMLNGAAPLAASIAALELGARQIVPPGVVLGAADLGVDEAVDALMTDGGCCLLLSKPAGDLLG